MDNIRIFQTANHQYAFHILAPNGAIIFSSRELYATRESCQQAVNLIKIAAKSDSNFERITNSAGNHLFALKSQNGLILGKSEAYASITGREYGIAALKKAVSTNNSPVNAL